MANEVERRRWNDANQVAGWHKRERFTDRITPYVVAAASPRAGERVLDIGAGGGKLSLAIAPLVLPGGRVTGADISEGMVEWAMSRAAEVGAANASFTVADMQTETADGGPFDLVVSQFGVMFFDEPVTAFTNIRRQVKPGGRIAFACWQASVRNAWHTGKVLAGFAPPAAAPSPGKSPTGPFSLADPRATRRILRAAGFTEVERRARSLVVVTAEEAVRDPLQVTGLRLDAARQAEAEAAMERHFAHFRRADGLSRFELRFQVFTARNP